MEENKFLSYKKLVVFGTEKTGKANSVRNKRSEMFRAGWLFVFGIN